MFVLFTRACISFGPKNRSIGAAAKSQVGGVLCFPKTNYFYGLSIFPFINYLSARYVSYLVQVGPRHTTERDLIHICMCLSE